ncbi:MAG: shikimate kinase [Clostridiales bacterium]|nr:shikimate kinase [Clostridiales bacterium]
MKKKNIILIGMPGCGKTTIGTEISETLGYGYIDSDSVIVAREGKRLNEIIEEVGREAFLDIEAKVNSELCADRCVIATGGSVIYRDFAMQKLKEMGTVVYLKHPFEVIKNRLGDLKKRGVALKEGFTLKDLYEERTPLYEKYADVIVEMPNGSIADSVIAVIKALNV